MTKTPARQAIGMCFVSGPRKSRMSRRTTACTIPATGVFPPLLMFVIVRAIAPVTGIPPKRGDYDIRCTLAINSVLELCLSPVTPSATGRREQGFDGAQDGYRKGRGEKEVYHLHIKLNRRGLGHGCLDGKAVADGFDAGEVEIRPPHIDCHRHHNDSHQRTGHPLRKTSGSGQ